MKRDLSQPALLDHTQSLPAPIMLVILTMAMTSNLPNASLVQDQLPSHDIVHEL